jgi:hypothetical protein
MARVVNYWITIIHIFYSYYFFAIQKQSINLKEKTLAIQYMSIIYNIVEHYEPKPRATPSYSQSYIIIIKLTIAGSCARFWLKSFELNILIVYC